jgi:hypothetical protein
MQNQYAHPHYTRSKKMVFGQYRYAVATFTNRKDMEQVLNELYRAGFTIGQIFVVTKDVDNDEQLGQLAVSDRAVRTSRSDLVREIPQEGTATAGTLIGSILGAITGCFVGLGLLSVPGLGLALAIGTSGTTLVTTITGAALGAASCGLIEVCAGLELSEDRTRVNSNRCSKCEYLVMVDGTDDQVARAKSILKRL